jgi:hypothetical protein
MFLSHKDEAGLLSNVNAGRGWIEWSYCATPENAEIMIQFLAEEVLRPSWTKAETLAQALSKAWTSLASREGRAAASHAFRASIGDANIPQLPFGPIDEKRFIGLWENVRRPVKAVLHIAGDIESAPVKRPIYQHFGPWEGIRADKPSGHRPALPTAEWPRRAVYNDWGKAEAWFAWKLDSFEHAEAVQLAALMPWLLKASMPAWDEVIDRWDADSGGRWLRAIGQPATQSSELEAHVMAHLQAIASGMITQKLLDDAIAAKNEHSRAKALYPDRALQPDLQIESPSLERLKEMLKECLKPDCLAVLVMGALA